MTLDEKELVEEVHDVTRLRLFSASCFKGLKFKLVGFQIRNGILNRFVGTKINELSTFFCFKI